MESLNHSRYERQIALPDFGPQAQRKLQEASVLVIGAGGLGAPVLTYLTAAGVGGIGILDGDTVSAGNLNRQFLFEEAQIGQRKADCAAARLRRLNSSCEIRAIADTLTGENAQALLSGYRLAVLCLDSVGARITANRAAVALAIPYVEGAVAGYHATQFTYLPGRTACYECLHRGAHSVGQPVAVLGAMAGIVGSHMALAAIGLLIQGSNKSSGSLIVMNGLTHETHRVAVERDPNCPVCGGGDLGGAGGNSS